MRQKINYIRHLSILFLSIIIFFLGVLISSNVENKRVSFLYTQLQEQDLDYQNIVVETQYLDYLLTQSELKNSTISCDSLISSYYTSISNLDDSRLKLENYINIASTNNDEYYRLKSHYENVQINYLVLANRVSNLCENQINVILYFYEDKEQCPTCEDQGVYLDYVKKKLENKVLIFSFDSNREGPINLIAKGYGVKQFEKPILIINDKVFSFSTKDEIFSEICNSTPTLDVCE